MLIFKGAQVINQYVQFAFLFVQTVYPAKKVLHTWGFGYGISSNKRPGVIRIITFHGKGDGRLIEARVLTNNT